MLCNQHPTEAVEANIKFKKKDLKKIVSWVTDNVKKYKNDYTVILSVSWML